MLLSDFVDSFWGIEREDFRKRFPHPFLLAQENPHEADRGRAVFPLGSGSGVDLVVGRGERCHLRIRDSLVSTLHAELLPPVTAGGPWSLVDRDSTNHTFVDDEELEPGVPVELKDGCRITLGISSHFVFMDSGSFFDVVEPLKAAREEEPDLGTDIVSPPKGDRATEVIGNAEEVRAAIAGEDAAGTIEDLAEMGPPKTAALEAPEAEPEEGSDPEITGDVLLFCDSLDPIPIHVGQRLVIGRKADAADIVFADRKVSRKHAEIERREDGWVYVRDLGSSNGTWVGSFKVGLEWRKLPPGMILKIHSYRLRLDLPQLEGSGGLQTLSTESVTSLAELPLADLLAQLEEDKRSGILRIVTPNLKGQIGFNDGVPLYAATSDGLKMEPAILRMFKETEGTCTLFASERGGPSKMTRSFSELVLEEFLTDG